LQQEIIAIHPTTLEVGEFSLIYVKKVAEQLNADP